MLSPSEIFWHNVVDCLKKYHINKIQIAKTIYDFTDYGKLRKNHTGIYTNLSALIKSGRLPNNNWQVAIVEAIRIIDIDNFSTPVEFCDMYTIDFFKE